MTVVAEDVKHPIVVVDLAALCTISRKGNAILAKGAIDFLKQLPAMGAHKHYVVSDLPQRQLAEVQNAFRSHDMGVYGQKAVTTAEHNTGSTAYQHIALVIEQGGLLSSTFNSAPQFYPMLPENAFVITGSDVATADAISSGATVIESKNHDFAALAEQLKAVLPEQHVAANDVEAETGLRGIFAKRHDNVDEDERYEATGAAYDNTQMLKLIAQ